jgi:hypothetical protein
MSVGHPATPLQYFADLRLVTSLITGAWPATRNLIPAPDLADTVDQHIAELSRADPRTYRLHDTPPLDPHPTAALLAAAVRILDGDDLRILGQHLTTIRGDGKGPRSRWIRRYRRAGHDCSDGFRDALEPLIRTYQRADQRLHGRRAPDPQIGFGPQHIPEQLQDDWFHQHFHHIDGIRPRLLRRAAALRLVQMSTGGSLAEAATFLGIDHRYASASPGSSFATAACWTAEAGPAEFHLAVHALAKQLNNTPNLIDYKHRRDALHTWCIDPTTWQDILDRLPHTKGPFQPDLGDCKRQFASEVVWARITQGEHVLAPRPIEEHLPDADHAWTQRRSNMWTVYLTKPHKPHYAALRDILNTHADNLAATIDRESSPHHTIDHGDK